MNEVVEPSGDSLAVPLRLRNKYYRLDNKINDKDSHF
jgi:hypothetical protein